MLKSKRPDRDFREMREMLRTMQAGELTVSRGIEILEQWDAGNWSDDMLPPVRADICFDEDSMPVDVIDRLKVEIESLRQHLAASQAREQQLLNLLTDLSDYYYNPFEPDNQSKWWHRIKAAINSPTDTAALQPLLTKAGEVMRERCTDAIDEMWSKDPRASDTTYSTTIRALPPITLDDLK